MANVINPTYSSGQPLPYSAWLRDELEMALTDSMLKLAAAEAKAKQLAIENANLTDLLRQQLIATAGPLQDRETLPAPAPDGCACDDEKTEETNWLALQPGD